MLKFINGGIFGINTDLAELPKSMVINPIPSLVKGLKHAENKVKNKEKTINNTNNSLFFMKIPDRKYNTIQIGSLSITKQLIYFI